MSSETLFSSTRAAPRRRPWPVAVLAGALLLMTGPPALAQEAAAPASMANSSPDPVARLQGPALLAALRQGGHVVYFRHTATDFSKNDDGMTGYADCERQRLLSPQGQRDATQIGQRIRALGLPVGEALASPYCRTMDHARRMLGAVTPRNEIRESQQGDYAGLKRLLAAPVAAGGNRWIVGHGTPFRAVAGPPHLAEGEAVVIRPGTTGWTVLARLSVTEWRQLGAAE